MKIILLVPAIITCMSFALIAEDIKIKEEKNNNYKNRHRIEQKKMSGNEKCIKETRKTRKKIIKNIRKERRSARKELKAGK